MSYFEVFEFYVESFTVGTSSHQTNLNWGVVLQPCISHHHVSLVVEGIENLYGIQSSDCLYPDIRYGLVEGNDTPVACMVSNDRTQIEFSVDKLDTGLDVVSLSMRSIRPA